VGTEILTRLALHEQGGAFGLEHLKGAPFTCQQRERSTHQRWWDVQFVDHHPLASPGHALEPQASRSGSGAVIAARDGLPEIGEVVRGHPDVQVQGVHHVPGHRAGADQLDLGRGSGLRAEHLGELLEALRLAGLVLHLHQGVGLVDGSGGEGVEGADRYRQQGGRHHQPAPFVEGRQQGGKVDLLVAGVRFERPVRRGRGGRGYVNGVGQSVRISSRYRVKNSG
jgi:hypothetical protein